MAKRRLYRGYFSWLDTQYQHSRVYSDDCYEYKSVIVPSKLRKNIPNNQILTESEWLERGIRFPSGWEQYMIYRARPDVLCLRRPLPSKRGKSKNETSNSLSAQDNAQGTEPPAVPVKRKGRKKLLTSPVIGGSPISDEIMTDVVNEMHAYGMILPKEVSDEDVDKKSNSESVEESSNTKSKENSMKRLWARITSLRCKKKTEISETSKEQGSKSLRSSQESE